MTNQQPVISDMYGSRRFACSAAGILVFIVDEKERILLLSHPQRKGRWEVINGALEAEETILEGAIRETREEIGKDVRVHPLGTVHAYTFRYDANVQYMISLCYLMAYEGGQVLPGDDMKGSQVQWWSLEELADERIKILVPEDQKWIINRAIELYRLWKDQEVDLQPAQDPNEKSSQI